MLGVKVFSVNPRTTCTMQLLRKGKPHWINSWLNLMGLIPAKVLYFWVLQIVWICWIRHFFDLAGSTGRFVSVVDHNQWNSICPTVEHAGNVALVWCDLTIQIKLFVSQLSRYLNLASLHQFTVYQLLLLLCMVLILLLYLQVESMCVFFYFFSFPFSCFDDGQWIMCGQVSVLPSFV